MRVLLIDSSSRASAIELMLRTEGFHVFTTDFGKDGIGLAKIYDYDILISEIELPDMSGMEVIQSLRDAYVSTPILVLSRNVTIEAKVKALDFGADDYMTKPFHKDELVARIRAIRRRVTADDGAPTVIGNLHIYAQTRTVRVNGRPVSLPELEYRVLEGCAGTPGAVVSYATLMACVYLGERAKTLNALHALASRLRQKLLVQGWNGNLKNKRGEGYEVRVAQCEKIAA